jgi:hypothetical protein
MTDNVITLRVSDELQHELETLAAQFGYTSVNAFIEALQPEIVESFRESLRAQLEAADDRLWDQKFENSQDVLEVLAREAREEHRAGLTEPFDPDNDPDEE